MDRAHSDEPPARDGRLDRLRSRLEHRREAVRGQGAKLAERIAHASSELRHAPVLKHALAALERGNHQAAFWLLREELEARPDGERAVLAYFDAAVRCERPQDAAPAMLRYLHRQAFAGECGLAAGQWIALVREVPDARLDPGALLRILPELEALVGAAPDDQSAADARGLVRTALRHAAEAPDAELAPGLALRLFEAARELDAEVAQRAAELALRSPNLHDVKRERLEAALRELAGETPVEGPPADSPVRAAPAQDPGGPPEPAPAERPAAEAAARASTATPARPPPEVSAPAVQTLTTSPSPLRVCEATPVELDAQGLILTELESGLRTRLDYRAVEAVAVALIEGGEPEPRPVVDLVLRRHGEGPRQVVRLRDDRAPLLGRPGDTVPNPLLASLLERTHAVPLPDPESALGIQPRRFASLEAYQREVLLRV